MNEVLTKLKEETKNFLGQRLPKFYSDLSSELNYAKRLFFEHPLIRRCCEDVIPFIRDQFGHGVEHAKKVAIEAGAIVLAESFTQHTRETKHLVLLAELAGLLHDICRLEEDHATKGAILSRKILKDFPLSPEDIDIIAFAVENHEAFQKKAVANDFIKDLISDSLYDADKFRWGPDNFATTLWEICDYMRWDLEAIVERFPKGLEIISSIKDSFRTLTGQIYGPEFIEIGVEVGNYIYRRLKEIIYAKKSD